jgi:ABC-type lipoprotein export system ATPase subunit
VRIDDEDVWTMTDRELSALRARQIGFIFQFPSLLPSLSVLENVTLPSRFAGGNRGIDVQDRAVKLLETVGLAERMEVYPRQLSSGEQKRVVIARALINQPSILLADEPTSDLDEQTEHEIMSLLKEIHSGGLTIVMVTHNLDLVTYASRVMKMENGSLVDLTGRKATSKNGRSLLSPTPVQDTTFAQ